MVPLASVWMLLIYYIKIDFFPIMIPSEFVLLIVTIFWGTACVFFPLFVPRGPNRGVLQVFLLLVTIFFWLYWMFRYMVYMNPLTRIKSRRAAVTFMREYWS